MCLGCGSRLRLCRTLVGRVWCWRVCLCRYPSAQVVIADGAYDKEGLLEWLLEEFCVALACVRRAGQGFVVLPRRWLVERSFAWLLGCGWLSRCYDGLCVVEACWIEWACVRWFVRRMAEEEKC